jgi:hypothetical protein
MIKQMLKWQIINKHIEEPDQIDQAFFIVLFNALKRQKNAQFQYNTERS